ncbi:MAG: hypothetical protein ACOYEJ_09190 [Mahellales bacterium]|jgi:hypothetical protein
MLFIVGLDSMSREEKIALLAQMNCLTSLNIINEGTQKGIKTTKQKVLKGVSWITGKFSKKYGDKIERLNIQSDWDVEILREKIAKEHQRLVKLTDAEISKYFREKLIKLAKVNKVVDDKIIANAILHRAAKSMNIDVRLYLNAEALENAIFEAAIIEQIEQLKKFLELISAEDIEGFETKIKGELSKLSQVEIEAIEQAMGIENLTSKAFISFLKTTSGTAVAQIALSGFGFGIFLFLTTSIKALSLLLGITLPFSVYTTATTTLAFLLSAPFFLIIAAVSGGLIIRFTDKKIDDHMAKLFITIGRLRLMSKREE